MKGPLILFLLLFYEFVSSIPFNTLLVSFYLPTSAPITSNLLLKKSTISGVVVAQLAELSFPVPKVMVRIHLLWPYLVIYVLLSVEKMPEMAHSTIQKSIF